MNLHLGNGEIWGEEEKRQEEREGEGRGKEEEEEKERGESGVECMNILMMNVSLNK